MPSKPSRRWPKRPSPKPAQELVRRVRSVERSEGSEAAQQERDAIVAMIVVRAIDRAKELVAVEGGGLSLRRALSAAEKPMAGFVERHLAQKRRERRKKA